MTNVLLSPLEIKELDRLCSDPLMELGMNLRPKHVQCLTPNIVTHRVMLTIRFNEHDDAQKWNDIYKERILRGGHIGTIVLSMIIGLLAKNAKYAEGIAVSAGSSIAKDHLQSKIWFPEMFEGWVLTRYYNFRYEQYPNQKLYMSWTDVIQNQAGKEMERRDHGQIQCAVGVQSGIPEKLVRQIMTTPPVRTIDFK
jgi:hypothetical protein